MLFLRKGNLILNGDFESGEVGCPPYEWESVNVTVVEDQCAFSGTKAALLGSPESCEPAVLYQDVEVCPRHRYQLSFRIGAYGGAKGPVLVQVRWLDACGADLGTGLNCLVMGGDVPDASQGFWDAHVEITGPAPSMAVCARVLFTAGSPPECGCPAVIDAVTFADIS